VGREAKEAGGAALGARRAAEGVERCAPSIRRAARRAGTAAVVLKWRRSRNGRGGARCAEGGATRKPERLERMRERTSSVGERRAKSAAPLGVRRARPDCPRTGAPRMREAAVRRRGRLQALVGAALVEARAALVETCDALGVTWEAPGNGGEALRSRGEDSRGISRPPRTDAGARTTRLAARRGSRAAPASAWGGQRRVREVRARRSEHPCGGRSARPAPRSSRVSAREDRVGGEESLSPVVDFPVHGERARPVREEARARRATPGDYPPRRPEGSRSRRRWRRSCPGPRGRKPSATSPR